MGTWKPLLPYKGGTMLEATLDSARTAGLGIILVTGFRGEELARLVARSPDVRVVFNPRWESGQLSSVLAGAAALEGPYFFLTLGDLPLIEPATYGCLRAEAEARLRAAQDLDSLPPLFASYGGEAGHPVLLRKDLVLAVPRWSTRMRDYLVAFNPILVDCGDPGVLRDVDTPEDYAGLP